MGYVRSGKEVSLPLGAGGNFSDVYNSDQPFNPNTNPNPNPNEGIPRTLGQRCGRCFLGKVCVGRPRRFRRKRVVRTLGARWQRSPAKDPDSFSAH